MKYLLDITIDLRHKCNCEHCDLPELWKGQIIVEASSEDAAIEAAEGNISLSDFVLPNADEFPKFTLDPQEYKVDGIEIDSIREYHEVEECAKEEKDLTVDC